MHVDEQVALITEARWHMAATLLVLPLLVLGLVELALPVFAAMEMGLAGARRRPALRAVRSGRRAQAS